MGTRITSTHNPCFEQKYEDYQMFFFFFLFCFFSENFHFFFFGGGGGGDKMFSIFE